EPMQVRGLTSGASGEAREKGLYDAACDFCFADLKGDLDSLGELVGGFHWQQDGLSWLNPARAATIAVLENLNFPVGYAGQLARRVAEKLKLRQNVFLAELELDPVYAAMRTAKEARRYEPLPKFPSVE